MTQPVFKNTMMTFFVMSCNFLRIFILIKHNKIVITSLKNMLMHTS